MGRIVDDLQAGQEKHVAEGWQLIKAPTQRTLTQTQHSSDPALPDGSLEFVAPYWRNTRRNALWLLCPCGLFSMSFENSNSPPDEKRNAVIDATLSREKLYELAWSEPMLKVGARFGVSSSYMARVCTLLNVTLPL